MSEFKDISVAILAGGQSRRFGSRKEEARWEGKSLIARAVDLAREISPRILFIGDVSKNPDPDCIPSFGDLYPGNGPLGGIHAGLHYCATDFLATLPCDMPLMTREVFACLFQKRHASRPVVAMSDSGLEPLICIWPRSALVYITEQLASGKNGPIPILDTLQAIRIPVHEILPHYHPRLFININTRQQLAAIQDDTP